jgi:hypothetical protein
VELGFNPSRPIKLTYKVTISHVRYCRSFLAACRSSAVLAEKLIVQSVFRAAFAAVRRSLAVHSWSMNATASSCGSWLASDDKMRGCARRRHDITSCFTCGHNWGFALSLSLNASHWA